MRERYPLSYRNLEEMISARGLNVCHTGRFNALFFLGLGAQPPTPEWG